MKRFIALLISMIAACVISAQVSTQNYIRNRKMLNNVGSSYLDDINYFDGWQNSVWQHFRSMIIMVVKQIPGFRSPL